MKFFRPRPTPAGATTRFRPDAEWFTLRHEDGVYVAEVRAEPERAVDLFHSLTEEMPPVVDLSLECLRTELAVPV